MIRLITFDLDNTLWAVDPVIRRADQLLQAYLADQVPGYHDVIDQPTMGRLRERLLAEQPSIRHDLSAARQTLLERALLLCNVAPARARRVAADAFELFLDARHDVALFEDVHPVLEHLSERYTLGALTNGNADVARLSIAQYFSFQHSSASVGASKPDPTMFLAALEQTGVPAAQTVHVGDNLIDDVQGAAAVGMHTIWVNFSGATVDLDPGAKEPSLEVESLAQLPAAITSLVTST